MNEKLKEAYEQFRHDCWPYDEPPNSLEILAAAARGEIPGFRLLDEGAAKDAERWRHARSIAGYYDNGDELSSVAIFIDIPNSQDMMNFDLTPEAVDGYCDAAMLTASREEQK